jgi:hypothetical protein
MAGCVGAIAAHYRDDRDREVFIFFPLNFALAPIKMTIAVPLSVPRKVPMLVHELCHPCAKASASRSFRQAVASVSFHS